MRIWVLFSHLCPNTVQLGHKLRNGGSLTWARKTKRGGVMAAATRHNGDGFHSSLRGAIARASTEGDRLGQGKILSLCFWLYLSLSLSFAFSLSLFRSRTRSPLNQPQPPYS